MSSCCHNLLDKAKQECPQCGGICLMVPTKTVIHHVYYPENQHLGKGSYALCLNGKCDVGYFSERHVLKKERLRFLRTDEESVLCYCFDISRAAYLSAMKCGDSAMLKDFVITQTKDTICACDIRNPSGKCCLGAFKDMEKSYDQTSKHHT